MTKTRILVVDDEPDLLAELAPLLERTGFSVVTASDGQQALNIVSRDPPDLIVLDVLMPRLDGREVLRQLRQSGQLDPVILLTRVALPLSALSACRKAPMIISTSPLNPLN